MKNIIISGLLLACISLMACKKDNIEDKKALILGKWNFTTVVAKNFSTQTETVTKKSAGSFVDFKNDGEMIINSGANDVRQTWELINKNSIKLNTPTVYTIAVLNESDFSFYYDSEENGEITRYTWRLTKPYASL